MFYPKYRRKVLVNGVDTGLKEVLNTKAHELQTDILEMEILPDHMHLLIQCDPQFGIHRVVKQLKGYTSHVLRREFPSLKPVALAVDAFVFCGHRGGCGQTLYIENQKGK